MKIVALTMIIVPICSLIDRRVRGKTYRELKKNHQHAAFVREIIRQTKKYYETQWWHRVMPVAGTILLMSQYI
jgi:hypothetical protein|tara:strand:+ start:610 stop:828 length:219 start_codon:yes stop_codon:yes gene_type:complete